MKRLRITLQLLTIPWQSIIFAVLVLGLALAVRLWMLAGAEWLMEGDDALSALMAFDILEGDRPIMLKEQHYAGAWQPYTMALSYLLVGPSRLAARLPSVVASLALVGAAWLLARGIGGTTAGRYTALLMALPPAYVLILTLKPLAPYTEVAVCGALALWCALHLDMATPPAAMRRHAAACGLLGGLAFWLHPIAIYFLAAIALLCLLHLRGLRLIQVAVLGLAGFLAGAAPVWLYNFQTHGATVRLLLGGARGDAADPPAVLVAWWHHDLPRALGLWNPFGEQLEALAVSLTALVGLALGWALARRLQRGPGVHRLDGLVLLLLTSPLIFSASGFGESALNPYGIDATGRYGQPIWVAVAVLLGVFLAALAARRRATAVGLAGVALVANSWAYLATDPVLAFQSTYWTKLPTDNRPLLDTLEQEGIAHVWLNHWAAFPLMLDARSMGQPLIAYDWHDVDAGGIDRFPEHLRPMEQALRAAYILVTDDLDSTPEARLRELGVAYGAYRLPPYLVLIPRSRTVHPSELRGAIDATY